MAVTGDLLFDPANPDQVFVFDGADWRRVNVPPGEVTLELNATGKADVWVDGKKLGQIKMGGVQTVIGRPYGDRQCPVWLPQNPNVPHAYRKQCVRFGPHSEHTDTYVIDEQVLS